MSQKNAIKYKDLINYKELEVNNLPIGVSISTMCCSAKLGSLINITEIKKYLALDDKSILKVKLNNDEQRSLLDLKQKNKKKKGETTVEKVQKFYNQITVVMRIYEDEYSDINDVKKINFKLFKNGSIQMSGCKKIKEVNIAINKLVNKLKEKKVKIIDNDGKKEVFEISFLENPELVNVSNFKIDMINSNYQVNLQIDRSKLYNLLLKKKIPSCYEKCIRACVIVKYTPVVENPEGKEISIFVFQKGNIIITGAKSKKHIIGAYKYLNGILLEHIDEISKKNEKEEEEILLGLYDEIVNENSHKLELLMLN